MIEIISVAIGIFCVYFGYRLAHSTALETIRITEFNKAAASFRSAFASALATIYLAKKHGTTDEVPRPDVDKFLREALLDQASAIEMFRPFICRDNRDDYQDAWEKYRYEVWNYGFEAESFRTDIDDPFKVFEDIINNILSFANKQVTHNQSLKRDWRTRCSNFGK